MPKKIRELISDLEKAGFDLEKGGKGSHRKYGHTNLERKVTLSGKLGSDAKRYQEKEVEKAIKDAS